MDNYQKLKDSMKIINDYFLGREEGSEELSLFKKVVKNEDYELIRLFFDKNDKIKYLFKAMKILAKFGSVSLLRRCLDDVGYEENQNKYDGDSCGDVENDEQGYSEDCSEDRDAFRANFKSILLISIVEFDRADFFNGQRDLQFSQQLSLKPRKFFYCLGKYNAKQILSYIEKNFDKETIQHENILYGFISSLSLSSSSFPHYHMLVTEDEVKDYFLKTFKAEYYHQKGEDEKDKFMTTVPNLRFEQVFTYPFRSLSLFLFFLEQYAQHRYVNSAVQFEQYFRIIAKNQTNAQIVHWFLEDDGRNIATIFKNLSSYIVTVNSFITVKHQYFFLAKKNIEYLATLIKFSNIVNIANIAGDASDKENSVEYFDNLLFSNAGTGVGSDKRRDNQVKDLLVRYPTIFDSNKNIDSGSEKTKKRKIEQVKNLIKFTRQELAKYISCADIINIILLQG
jgi:hypothetical protein